MAYYLDRCAELAAAVVEHARREAVAGHVAAVAWLTQVRHDILDCAPPHLAERWAAAPPIEAMHAPARRVDARPTPRRDWTPTYLALIADGLTSAQAAHQLGLCRDTPQNRARRNPRFAEAVAAAQRAAQGRVIQPITPRVNNGYLSKLDS